MLIYLILHGGGEAAVVHGPGEPFVVEEVRVDPPQKMEVRIRILFTSICHTDLSAWQGEVYIYIHIYIHQDFSNLSFFLVSHNFV